MVILQGCCNEQHPKLLQFYKTQVNMSRTQRAQGQGVSEVQGVVEMSRAMKKRSFWRYRAEAGKQPGTRFARLRRGPRHIEASFMCRCPRRTAFGRPRLIGKPPPADWEIFGNFQPVPH